MELVLNLPKSRLDHLLTVIVRKGGPRGFREKNLQKLDSMQLKGGFIGI